MEQIPQPHPTPLLGNIPDIKHAGGLLGLMRLADRYGPIFRLTAPPDHEMVIVSSQELVDDLCDESRFDKAVTGPLLHAVLPLNPPAVVDRALDRFDVDYDSAVVVRTGDGSTTFLPTDTPVAAGEWLDAVQREHSRYLPDVFD